MPVQSSERYASKNSSLESESTFITSMEFIDLPIRNLPIFTSLVFSLIVYQSVSLPIVTSPSYESFFIGITFQQKYFQLACYPMYNSGSGGPARTVIIYVTTHGLSN